MLFCFSSDSNRHVLRTLADTGGGAYEQFDPRSKSTWEAKVTLIFHLQMPDDNTRGIAVEE